MPRARRRPSGRSSWATGSTIRPASCSPGIRARANSTPCARKCAGSSEPSRPRISFTSFRHGGLTDAQDQGVVAPREREDAHPLRQAHRAPGHRRHHQASRRPPRQAGRERSFRPFRRSKKNNDPPSGAAPGGEPTFSFLSERQQPFVGKRGDPGRTRTCDLQLRRLLLYPLSYGAEAGLFVQLCLAAMRKARSPP